LLRVLQDHEFKPVGGSRSRRADVRVVAATHHDLAAAVVEGRFRADLRFRLDVLRLHLPPLRDRLADVLPLAQHFLRLAAPGKQFSRAAAQRLMGHDWPGNVRELRNVMERAAAASRSDVLGPDDIDLGGTSEAAPLETPGLSDAWSGMTLPEAVAKLERQLIADALHRSGGNRAEAARLLGIRRQLLYAKLVALGLEAS
jgi:two-component system NtrC family response regulator